MFSLPFPSLAGPLLSRGCLSLIVVLFLHARSASAETPLDRYVQTSDASHAVNPIFSTSFPGFQVELLDMTSLTWRNPSEVDRSEWQHYMTIITPDVVRNDTALLIVTGGSNSSVPPNLGNPGYNSLVQDLAQVAAASGSVVINLPTIPNEPLTFSDEGLPRSEDEIIAYTFDKFIQEYQANANAPVSQETLLADRRLLQHTSTSQPRTPPDSTWPLLMPMVKSAVTAMDTVQARMPGVSDFVVSGGSKRAWTTWLTAAVDPRVKAIIPASFDFLNQDEQLVHHRETYEGVTDFIVGGYSQSLEDYVALDLPQKFVSEAGQELLKIVDPFEYRDQLTMPKFLLNATGDEFFVSDSMQFYLDQIPGQNHVRYVPNAGHGLNDEAVASANLMFAAYANDLPLPEYLWTVEDDGRTIRVETPDGPVEVLLWQATNPESRDFRYGEGLGPGGDPLGVIWSGSSLLDEGDGTFVATIDAPESGATAFMVELTFDSGFDIPFIFTTEISVVLAESFGEESAPFGDAAWEADSFRANTVPEPATWVLATMGLVLLSLYAWRTRTSTRACA
jgi:PhoPQ-activated pathogenicity-related protein